MKKGILLLVLLLGFFSLIPAFGNELTEDYFDIATNYYNSNNSAKALEYLEHIISIEPDNIQAKELMEKISQPENTATQEEPLHKVPIPEEFTPEEFQKAQNTATMLNTTQLRPESIVIIETPPTVVEKPADKMSYNADYYNTKGQEFYEKKEYNSAIEYFYKSISLDKKNPIVYNNLGMAYWAKNNTDVAIKYFKKANELNRSYTQSLVNLANLYAQTGDSTKQVYYLQKAISYNSSDYLAYFWLGEYYKKSEQPQKAIENYKEVITINPKYSQAYMSLATSFFETEEFNYAQIALKQYLDLCPDSDYAYYLLARTNLAMSRYYDAKAYIEKAIQICNKEEYQFELGKIDYYLEDYKAALEIFQLLIETQDSAEIFNYIGLCHYKMRNIQLAITNFDNAIKSDGQRPIYYYNLAQCYKSLGDKKNYTKYANSATKTIPLNYQDFIDLSYIYYDNGNPSYAINTLNNAISKYPNVKSLYLSKLKIYEALSDNLHYNETKDLIELRFNRNEKTQKKK